MTGAAIFIDDASVVDTVLSVKERVFVVNPEFRVRQQRLMYRPGPCGMEPLADDETLGGAGVARDGTAELDVLLADLTEEDVEELGQYVWHERVLLSQSRGVSVVHAHVFPLTSDGF
jgi:hypothetical protein